MLDDARTLEDGQILECDLCIVGAGAAGITLAREFIGGGHSVVLLEGGGETYESASQALYLGSEQGTLLPPGANYLATTRLRYLGGTTNHWNGWCRPLDELDFQTRQWVAHSGWPIERSILEPYYDRAARVVQVSPFDYEESEAGVSPRFLEDDQYFDTAFLHISPPVRFGQAYRDELAAASNLRLLLHANVVEFGLTSGGRVDRVVVQCLDGPRFEVRPRLTVIAAGGIENARLLLAGSPQRPDGMGNAGDRLGHFFMDHPVVRVGLVAVPIGRQMTNFTAHLVESRGHAVLGTLRTSAELQREEELLNSLLILWERPITAPTPAVTALTGQLRRLAQPEDDFTYEPWCGELEIVSEQPPQPGNRVRLTAQRDRLGMRRVSLTWRLGEQAERSIARILEHFVIRMGERFAGRAKIRLEPEEPWRYARWSNHHMGTTRMDSNPRQGVVDAKCKVHGVEDLYVAGSSVFPTSGVSNPTLTLLALTFRLAEHLEERLTA